MTAAGGQRADGRDTTGTNTITEGLTDPESASTGSDGTLLSDMWMPAEHHGSNTMEGDGRGSEG